MCQRQRSTWTTSAGGQVPAIGQELVAAGRWGAVAGLVPARQDGTGPVVGAAEGDPLVGDDGDPSAVAVGQGRLDGLLGFDGDGRLGMAAGDQVEAGRARRVSALAVGAEVDDEGVAGQGRRRSGSPDPTIPPSGASPPRPPPPPAGAIRGRHPGGADPEPVVLRSASQPTRRHQPAAGAEVLVALVQARMRREPIEQQQAQGWYESKCVRECSAPHPAALASMTGCSPAVRSPASGGADDSGRTRAGDGTLLGGAIRASAEDAVLPLHRPPISPAGSTLLSTRSLPSRRARSRPNLFKTALGGESLPLARPDAPGVDRVALKRIASLATGDKIEVDVPTLRDKVDGYARYNRSQRRAWECWSGVPRAPDALGRPGRDSAPRPVTPRRNPPV